MSRDIQINSLSVTFHGVELLSDTRLELNTGRRYGLVGLNGSGEWSESERERETERERGEGEREVTVSPCLPQPTLPSGGCGISWRETNEPTHL